MFSKELENLIQATLEDGVLEEYEKAALVKRATAEGVDLAELEIYINSLLQKRQRELNEKKNAEYAALEKQKKEEFGKTCPACGKQVPSLALNCECGYEFKSEKRESAVQLLSERLSKIVDEERYLDAITIFPVPNTKEDIMEFLALAAPNSKYKGGLFGTLPKRFMILGILDVVIISILSGTFGADGAAIYAILTILAIVGAFLIDIDTLRWNKKAGVWRAKFEQVLMKGRSLRADAEFTRMLDYYEGQALGKGSEKNKWLWGIVLIILAVILFASGFFHSLMWYFM